MKLKYKNRLALLSILIGGAYWNVRNFILDQHLDISKQISRLLDGTATTLNYLDNIMGGVALTGSVYLFYRYVTGFREVDKQPDFRSKVSKAYEQFDGIISSISINPWYRKTLIKSLLDNVNSEDKRLVSLGGGSGRIENELAKLGFSIINTDISYKDLQECKSKNSSIECIVADAEHLPLRETSVDVVFSNEAIGHLNPSKVFEETHRILKEDGMVQISTWSNNRFNRFRLLLYDLYSPKEFTEYARDAEFNDITTREFYSVGIVPIPSKMMVTIAKK